MVKGIQNEGIQLLAHLLVALAVYLAGVSPEHLDVHTTAQLSAVVPPCPIIAQNLHPHIPLITMHLTRPLQHNFCTICTTHYETSWLFLCQKTLPNNGSIHAVKGISNHPFGITATVI